MKLQQFIASADPSIHQRGLNYYLEGRIEFFSEHRPGEWIARVQGQQVYHAEIHLTDATVLRTTCDCPYEGTLCKHAIALGHAILEEEQRRAYAAAHQVNQKMLSRPSFREVAAERARELGPEALIEFIAEWGKFRPDFQEALQQW